MSVLLGRSSMSSVVALFTVLSISGLAAADCTSTETVDSQASAPRYRSLLRSTGYQEFRAGQYQEAMACYVEALRVAEAGDPNNRSAIASDLNDIAVLSEEMGQYAGARKLYARELDLLQPLGEAAGAAVGEVYLELGGLSLIEGSLRSAEADFKKAIALLKRHAGPDDPRTAKALAGLGRLYAESGKYYEASHLLHDAKAAAEENVSRGNGPLITILDSEGALLSREGKFAEAEKRWLTALNLAEHSYGQDGVQYIALLLHLGQLYTEIHEYPSAQALLQRGLAVVQKTSGADEMDRAIMMSALGNVYLQQHKMVEAEPLFLQAIHTLSSSCVAVPLACASVRSSLGDYYMLKRQWQAADMEYEQALSMRENVLGEHPLVAASLVSTSRALRKLQRKKEANADVARAQQIMSLPGNAAFASDNTVDVRSFRAAN